MKRTLLRFANSAYDFTIQAVSRRTLSIRSDSAPSRSTNNVFTSILSPFESYVVSLQSLLIWERPYLSAVSFVLLNCLFWLVVSWNRRFFSIVAIIVLAVFLYRTWVDHIWPEIRVSPPHKEEEDENEEWIRVHPQHVSVPELSRYVSDFHGKLVIWWRDMMRLREANHGLFCLLWCAVFAFTAFIGHMVPGVVLIYCVVLALSLGPGIALHLIPSTIYDQLADLFMEDIPSSGQAGGACASRKPCDNDSDLEEFLPEASADILKHLSLQHDSTMNSMDPDDADDHHLSTIRELGLDSFVCESEDSSLYTGLGAFPSVEEENESDLEEDLSPNTSFPAGEDKNGIHFVPTHFKEDSSESENSDAVFTEGLSFAPIPEGKEPKEGMKAPEEGAESKQQPTKKVSSSSEFDDELMDFEILEDTDIS